MSTNYRESSDLLLFIRIKYFIKIELSMFKEIILLVYTRICFIIVNVYFLILNVDFQNILILRLILFIFFII